MARRRRQPVELAIGAAPKFPDPNEFDADGLVAFSGELTPAVLLAAYSSGIFPWYSEETVPLWWSPDPRAVMTQDRLHVSRSLMRTIRRGGFELSWNRCFEAVMTCCGENRDEGTWVMPEMVEAYVALHRLGHAHSLEVWMDGQLVGGTYGVQRGALFAAESMFHRRTDMSKVALVALVRSLFAAGIELLDVQFVTPHLASMGAFTMPRAAYLQAVRSAAAKCVDLRLLRPDPVAGGS